MKNNITICTSNRMRLFGEVLNGEIRLNEYGKIAQSEIERIPVNYNNVVVETFVVMPNHIHCLLLRKMTQTDYPALAAIIQDEQTMYAYEGAFDDKETQEWLDRQFVRYQEDGFGLWAAIHKDNEILIFLP